MKKIGYQLITALLLVCWSMASAVAENREIYTVQAVSSASEEKIIQAAPSEVRPGKTEVVTDSVGSEKIKSESGPVKANSEMELVFRGTVSDGEGRPVGGATVEILGIPLAAVKTGDNGSFAVSGFSPGTVFSLKIVKEGYNTVRSPVIEVPSGIKGQPEHYTMLLLPPVSTTTVAPVMPPPPKPEPLPPEPPPSPKPESPPSGDAVNIEADSISYNKDEDTYHAQGHVVITYSGGSTLSADSVVLNKATDDALAQGDVVVKSGSDVFEGERVTFNIVTKMGVASPGKVFLAQNHFYLKGKKIEKKGEATYRVYDALATTCDGDSPDWQLKGSMLDVNLDGYGTLRDGELLVSNVPLLYMPYLIFPAKTTRQSGFLYPHISYSQDKNGIDVEVPFYWAISPSSDATFYQRYMEKRGFKEGVEYRYFLDKDSFGTFYGDYMNDSRQVRETAGNISRDWQSDQKRWSFYLNHETTFSPTSYIRADIMRVSDPWYFRDFESSSYYLDNYSQQEQRFKKISFLADQSLPAVYSLVRLVKNWSLYNLTGLVAYGDDFTSVSNDATLQRYPEITFTGIQRPIMDSPYYLAFAGTYDYFYRTTGQKGQLYDIQPVLSRPFNLGAYLQVTPLVAVRETYWSRDDSETDGNKRQGDRPLYSLGLNLNTEVHRIFNIGGQTLDKIRHGIVPEVTYTYIPYVFQENIPNYVIAVPEQNTLTYGLTNTFLARLKEKGGGVSYLEFLRLKLFQTYDLKEARRGEVTPGPERRPFSDVTMELDFSPFSYLYFGARNIFSVNSGYWRQTNYDVNVSDVRGDTATIGYRYTQYSLEEVNLSLKAALTRSLDAIFVLRRNEFDHITMERTYGIKYRQQCWSTEISYSERASTAQSTDKIFMVMFSLYGLGQVGQEVWKSAATTGPQL